MQNLILKRNKFLKWLKIMQLKGISHKKLNELIIYNNLSELALKNNAIINSYKAPIANKNNTKYIIKDKYLQIYKIPEFISGRECLGLINIINSSNLMRTGKGLKFNSYTDKKCIIEDNPLIKKINRRMISLIGNSNSLPTLGMKYYQNDYKEKHFDNPWKFHNGKLELGIDSLKNNSITTWTFMIYLNDVKKGGETFFPKINLKITPKAGMALIWNNLFIDGSINIFSEHQALEVQENDKYIITKWFKENMS